MVLHMNRGLLILILLATLSCNSCTRKEKIIPRNDLVELLVDLHIADAIAMNHSINENFGKLDSAILYRTVLEEHGYTRQQMEASIKLYSRDIEKMMGIYDDVFARLSKRSEDSKELYSAASPSRAHHLWKAPTSRYFVKGDSLKYPDPFELEVDTTGKFVLSAEIKLSLQDSSINPRISACFYDPENEVAEMYCKEVVLRKAPYTRDYMSFFEMNDPGLTHMRIIIPKQDNPDSLFMKSLEIYNIRLSLMEQNRNK